MPKNIRAELVSMGQVVSLECGDVLLAQSKGPHYLYFPYSGYISLVASVDQRAAMAMALIGNEGIVGVMLSSVFATDSLRIVVQGAGTALRVAMPKLQGQEQANAALRVMRDHSVSLLLAQFANTAACANFHALRPRLARSLLAIHDRAEADGFHMTHQTLADLLGVRRSAVSIAAHYLQQKSCIHYSRGNITIVDRKGLEKASCSCYQAMKS